MPHRFVVAIHHTDTQLRMAVVDRGGRIVEEAHRELREVRPQPGWLEYDPNEVWSCLEDTLPDLITSVTVDMSHIAAIGIASQRGAAVLWDRDTGEPICHAIAANCPRTVAMCERLAGTELAETVREKTGLALSSRSAATKIAWALENVDGARAGAASGDVLFGAPASWLSWKLTGGRAHVIDHTNASHTLLYNAGTREWDDELLEIFDVPRVMLPTIRTSSEAFGQTSGTELTPAGLLIGGIIGDEQAKVFAQGCHRRGTAKLTFGDACVPVLNTGEDAVEPPAEVSGTTVCGPTGQPLHALEASLPMGATVVDWLRDGVGLIATDEDAASLAEQPDDSAGVQVVPSAEGGDSGPRWAILGLSPAATKAHVVRASLESIAHQAADALQGMTGAAGVGLQTLRADGPGAANDFLLQFEADMLDVVVERPAHPDLELLGAAFIAGLASGFWLDADETASLVTVERRFEPQMPHGERTRRRAAWEEGLAAARGWPSEPAEDED
jgi:glycerol kinase